MSAALGEAGHEVEGLGFEGIPDAGPVIKDAEDFDRDEKVQNALDIAATEFPAD